MASIHAGKSVYSDASDAEQDRSILHGRLAGLAPLRSAHRLAPRTSPGGTGGLPWTHRAEVVADDDAQQEGQAPGPRFVHCLGSCGPTPGCRSGSGPRRARHNYKL
jgi:hypothetical protein